MGFELKLKQKKIHDYREERKTKIINQCAQNLNKRGKHGNPQLGCCSNLQNREKWSVSFNGLRRTIKVQYLRGSTTHYGVHNYKNATMSPKCWPNDVDKLINTV